MSSLDDLGEKIRLILLSSCKKVNIHELTDLYYHSYDCTLNFRKFGFNTLKECLESIPKYVKVVRNGYNHQLIPVVSEKFLEYENLISAPNKTVKGFAKRPRAIIVPGSDRTQDMKKENSFSNHSKFDLSSLMEAEREVLESSYNPSIDNTFNKSKPVQSISGPIKNDITKNVQSKNKGIADIPSHVSLSNGYSSRPSGQSVTRKQQIITRNESKTENWIRNENLVEGLASFREKAVVDRKKKPAKCLESDKKKPFMSDDLRRKLYDLFAEHETGIWLTEVIDLFEQKYNESLRKFLGTESILSFCRSHSDVFQIERFKSDWRTFSTQQTIPDNLKELVNVHPTEIIGSWKKRQSDIVVNALPDDFDLKDYVNDIGTDLTTTGTDLNGVRLQNNLITPPLSPPPPQLFNDSRSKNNYHQLNFTYPADVAVRNDVVKKPLISTEWCRFQYLFEIKILEIIDPSQFWICISKKEVYNDILDQVEQFYKEKSNMYAMKMCHVHENHYCVVSYAKNEKENAFRRCKIISFKSVTEHVKVFLIDMGIVMNASINSIYYLRKEFLRPLQQAISVKLHQLDGENGIWQRNETNIFRDLTKNSRLYAAFKEVKDQQHLEIELFACHNATSTCINVAAEFAKTKQNL